MKPIWELKSERSQIIEDMETIVAGDINPAIKQRWNFLENRISNIDKEIAQYERQETINKNKISNMNEKTTLETPSFRAWVAQVDAGETKAPFKLQISERAETLYTTTNTNVINKGVANIDVMYSPAEQLLKGLGVKFYTNLSGNLVLPRMTEDTATYADEGADASSANMAPTSLTMSAHRVTHTQTISREFLSQTNEDIFNEILNNLKCGIWNAVANRFFDDLEVDASTQISNSQGTITLGDLVNLEASLGAKDLYRPSYVMQPQTKAYLKKTAGLPNQEAIWSGDKVNEYPAFATPSANTERVYFGDWTKTAIGVWGNGIEIIVDPLTQAKQGQIVLTAYGLFDSAVINKEAFSILSDASTY